MSVTTGPYPIAGGGSLRISLPRGTLVVSAVAVGNLTPAAISVTIGGSSKYVLPGGTDLFACNSGQSYVGVTSLGTPTDAGSITTTWFDPADEPGRYPYAGAITKITTTGTIDAKITGPVTIASGTVDLGAGTSVAINAGQLTSTTIPLQATAPQLLVTTFGTGETGTVTLSANATVTSPPLYRKLTLDAGVVLTSPWIVSASTQATLGTAASAIANSGSASSGAAGTGAAGGLAGSFKGGAKGGKGEDNTATTKNGTSPPTASWQGGAGGKSQWATTLHRTGGAVTSPLTTPILFGTIPRYSFAGGAGGGAATTNEGAGGGGVVMLTAKKITGAGLVRANGGNGVQKTSNYSGPGGGGIALVYTHTAKTWTGKATVLPGVTVTAPAVVAASSGSKVVRRRYVGAIF